MGNNPVRAYGSNPLAYLYTRHITYTFHNLISYRDAARCFYTATHSIAELLLVRLPPAAVCFDKMSDAAAAAAAKTRYRNAACSQRSPSDYDLVSHAHRTMMDAYMMHDTREYVNA